MRKRLFLFFVMSIYIQILFCQDKNSTSSAESQFEFANFLIDQQLYKFASEELERLHFQYPDNKAYFNQLIFSYRMSGNFEMIRKKLSSNLSDTKTTLEYTLVLIKNDFLDDAKKTLKSTDTDQKYGIIRDKIGMGLNIMSLDKATLTTYKTSFVDSDPKLHQLINESINLKTKSPVVAGILSGIVPGTGKMYSKDYVNGIISLLFIGATTYQAYTRFSKNGSKSVSGWIYGGIGFGFYLGNIYGSVKSAKRYNQKINKNLYDKTKTYITGINI